MSIKTLITNLLNSLLDGSFERMRIISQMNAAFKEYFMSGEFSRMCKVSISSGQSEYAHEMSSIWLRSGFKISIGANIGYARTWHQYCCHDCHEAFKARLSAFGGVKENRKY